MGATWFGSQHTALLALLNELELKAFPLFMEEKAYFQPFSTAPAHEVKIPAQEPSYRVAGGTQLLIQRLKDRLVKSKIKLNAKVNELQFEQESIKVLSTFSEFEASRVISAIPPGLFGKSIVCAPSLPAQLAEILKSTQTWMHNSIKVAVHYERPFWRHAEKSGTLFSNVGPMQEVYDQCSADGKHFALCGFCNGSFRGLEKTDRQARIIAQLELTFGEQARNFLACQELDWSAEPFTAADPSENLCGHQNNGDRLYHKGHCADRLWFIGAETSNEFGGYMEGAIRSVDRVM